MGLLFLVPILPLIGFAILTIFGSSLPKKTAGVIGCASVGGSFLISLVVLTGFLTRAGDTGAYRQTIYTWMNVAGLRVPFGFYLDPLSIIMMEVVTFVGFLIHLYASQSMYDEDGYSRFFAYMNLFIFFMLILVLADNLLLLYLGWEGVGLCSYLLIGFWYKDRNNGLAAQKAFIVTRIGDTAFAIGLFILFLNFKTFDIPLILRGVGTAWAAGGALAVATAALLLGGAVGKSAQLPLQVWLPDAMAGPTPVSALIHAATMVTAGVYLIARMHPLFLVAPSVLTIVAIIGAATALIAAFSASAQEDIKRVLAYSTISQIGYMFLALGVGAWIAAIFHLFTHAFFKALLFLSAGVVIDATGHDNNLFHMGGLRHRLPVAFAGFTIGAASLSSLPLITAGFFSKDNILWASYASSYGSTVLWLIALLTALLTAIYSFRAVFLAFYGPEKPKELHKFPGSLMKFSLFVLSFFAITAGYLGLPAILGGSDFIARFLHPTLPDIPLNPARGTHPREALLLTISGIVSLGGIVLGYFYFLRREAWGKSPAWSMIGNPLRRYFYAGWGFDWLYTWLFVRPYLVITRINRQDFFDSIFTYLSWITAGFNRGLSATETGKTRAYVTGILLGAILCILILLFR